MAGKKKLVSDGAIIPVARIIRAILLVRGQKVMLDADLAELYSVETKMLNRAVKRNQDRFPGDFMFQLTVEETLSLRYQSGTSNLRSQTVRKQTTDDSPRGFGKRCRRQRCSLRESGEEIDLRVARFAGNMAEGI